MYSTSNDHVEEETHELAMLFATHATLAIGHSRQVENLYKAIETRTMIGQAVGIVMERYGIDPDAAFNYLVRQAAAQERKLRLVAADIVGARTPSP